MATAGNYFELVVWLPGSGPLCRLFQADTLELAIEKAQAAYPKSRVQAPETERAKARLARSSTSQSVLQRMRYKRARKCTNTVLKSPKMSESVLLDQQRYDELEALYVKDGRDKRDHPMYSLYTGLYQAYLAGIAVETADTGEV